MARQTISEYAGLRRELEVGLCIAPSLSTSVAVARSVACYLDETPGVSVRLAGLASSGTRMLITVAVCLGTIDDIKAASPRSRAAILLLQRLVDDFASCDPAFVTLPRMTSFEAQVAARAVSDATLVGTVRQLVAIG